MRISQVSAAVALLLFAAVAVQAGEHTFVLNASIPCCSSGEHVFGWLDLSSAGIDPADVPEPPTPPADHIRAAFRMPGVVEPELWQRDLRATADFDGDGRESWELLISTNEPATTCTVTVTAGIGDATALRVIFAGAYQDTLLLPASISFPLDGDAQLLIEVISETVAVDSVNWGSVKSLFN